ncbi:MAG: SO_0444 family Cu/Zn efflux transporter [Gammaproteobacteria bacterium]|nr:SO_0444 family Cu/Zn efflux transporter [Gammaproteobacteria bacterium]
MIAEFLGTTLALYLDAAPWLLLGLAAAGVIRVWLPDALLARWLGGSGLWPVTKAALIGAPLPLCSCGVLPAALGLHRGGASRSATVSFLIATPETGADSIAVSYALLGPFMTVVRPVAAILGAIFTGLLTALLPEAEHKPLAAAAACGCANRCSAPPVVPDGVIATSRRGVRYAAVEILDDIAVWLAVGIVLAGMVATVIPSQALVAWGSGLPAMVLMLLAGIPMYICATASTPVAAALLLAGISPGTVLVFLLAGPATNIATLSVVRRELGLRVLLTYLLGIAVASIGLGLLTDLVATTLAIDIQVELGRGAELLPSWLAWGSGVLLAVLAIKPLRGQLIDA